MITIVNAGTLEYRGLSTDNKPVNPVGEDGKIIDMVANGAVFFCIDTGDAFMFNKESNKWIKL